MQQSKLLLNQFLVSHHISHFVRAQQENFPIFFLLFIFQYSSPIAVRHDTRVRVYRNIFHFQRSFFFSQSVQCVRGGEGKSLESLKKLKSWWLVVIYGVHDAALISLSSRGGGEELTRGRRRPSWKIVLLTWKIKIIFRFSELGKTFFFLLLLYSFSQVNRILSLQSL